MEKLLTIAIPTYNRADKLKRALKAISEQYDERIEIIVCDDASPDNTISIVEEMQSIIPIRYYRNDCNLHFNKNFLKCFSLAEGKYILLMGDDDFLSCNGLKHILSYLETNKDIDLIFINFKRNNEKINELPEEGKPYNTDFKDQIGVSKKEFIKYAGKCITCMNCIYLRERCIQCKENNLLKNDTYSFIHTVMGFVITSSDESRLGIIGQPCIIQNATPEDYNISKELDNFFKGFGKGVYYAFCDVAPKCGYDRRQMQGIFCDLFNDWKGVIIKLNAQKSNAFWEDGFPVVKNFFKAWIYLIPLQLYRALWQNLF